MPDGIFWKRRWSGLPCQKTCIIDFSHVGINPSAVIYPGYFSWGLPLWPHSSAWGRVSCAGEGSSHTSSCFCSFTVAVILTAPKILLCEDLLHFHIYRFCSQGVKTVPLKSVVGWRVTGSPLRFKWWWRLKYIFQWKWHLVLESQWNDYFFRSALDGQMMQMYVCFSSQWWCLPNFIVGWNRSDCILRLFLVFKY